MSNRSKTPLMRSPGKSHLLKVVIGLIVVSALFYLGQRGRNHAVLQGHFKQINSSRAQLETVLDSYVLATSQIQGAAAETNYTALLGNPQFQNLLSLIKTGLHQVEGARLTPHQDLEVRLTKAAVASAERQFDQALALLADSDVALAESFGEPHRDTLLSVIRVRADVFCGLHRWADALAAYQRLRLIDPEQIETLTRVADCFHALGRHGEAVIAYTKVARAHFQRGNALTLRDRIEPALDHYQSAMTIYSRVLQQDARSELALEWARSVDRYSDGLVLRGDAAAAVGHYDNAIELRNRLLASEGRRPEVLAELAGSLLHRGNAFLVQRRMDGATNSYIAAATIWTELVDRYDPALRENLATTLNHHADGLAIQQNAAGALAYYDQAIAIREAGAKTNSSLSVDLAIGLNNRGVAHRLQGDLTAAISDFSKAIERLAPAFEASQDNSPKAGTNISPKLVLDVLISRSEAETEIIARTRVSSIPARADLAVALATAFRNRAYVRLSKQEVSGALSDFENAISVYRRIVDQEGFSDLSLQYAKCLQSLAWLLSTHPDDAVRDAHKARELAFKACALTEWKAHFALEGLAAAAAESGNYAEATKRQLQAIELAPARAKAELQSRLAIYAGGKAFRSSPLARD